jgi:hypothetical protein
MQPLTDARQSRESILVCGYIKVVSEHQREIVGDVVDALWFSSPE